MARLPLVRIYCVFPAGSLCYPTAIKLIEKVIAMSIRIDYARARAVIEAARNAYRERSYPFNNIFLPQDQIPQDIRENKLVFACVLFYSCHYMRGTIKSDFAMRQIVGMYKRRPDLFNPSIAKDADRGEVGEFLRSFIPYRYQEIARSWIENSRRLAHQWDGDPRIIFSTARTMEHVHRFVANRNSVRIRSRRHDLREDGFLGFQKKMASMLAYFLESCGLITPLRKEIVPPIDFHHIRISLASRMILPPESMRIARYELLFPVLEKLYGWIMKEYGLGMRELGDMLWIVSERLCSESPATTYEADGLVVPNWNSLTIQKQHERTCGGCPLSAFCEYAVPAETYYKAGYFILHGKRPVYPHPSPLITEALIYPKKKPARPKHKRISTVRQMDLFEGHDERLKD